VIARRTPFQFALAIPLLVSMAAAVAADDAAPPSTLKDVIKDTLQDTIQGAIDGTLKDTLQEKVQQKVQDALVDTAEESSDGSPTQTKVVLRISKEFIRQHSPPAVEQGSPINRYLFGAHVTGTAVMRGQPVLTMDADHGKPVFTLHFNGTTTTRTVAVKNPVKAYNTGLGGFDVHREIRFDGSQFSEGPASIEATYRSRLDRLATPPRLRGWIVRRFAGPQIEKTRPQADAIALADTKATILKEFEEHTDRLVDDLNGNVPWKQTIALLVPQDAGWVSHFDNTKDWIVTSPGPEGAAVPELPEEAAELKAPVELWVHGKPNEMSATKVIALWSTVHVGLNRFRDLAPAQAAKATENLKPTVEGDWWVLRVGTDILEQFIEGLREDESAGPW
jgi:hypothetical protein